MSSSNAAVSRRGPDRYPEPAIAGLGKIQLSGGFQRTFQ